MYEPALLYLGKNQINNRFLIKCKARYCLQSTEPKEYANKVGISSRRFGVERSGAKIKSEQHKGRKRHIPQPNAEICWEQHDVAISLRAALSLYVCT